MVKERSGGVADVHGDGKETRSSVEEQVRSEDVDLMQEKPASSMRARKRRRRRKGKGRSMVTGSGEFSRAKFPRHSIEKALRIPRAILEQNAGRECSETEAAGFVGLGSPAWPLAVEISSALKYGLLERPSRKRIKLTDLARRILRPQKEGEELQALRQAVMKAPDISEVYNHYRGEDLPDAQFFENALVDSFKILQEKLPEFKEIFSETLKKARLLEEREGKYRVLDVSRDAESGSAPSETLKKLRVEETRLPARLSLACVRRFQLRSRLGPPWRTRGLPPLGPRRADFPQRVLQAGLTVPSRQA